MSNKDWLTTEKLVQVIEQSLSPGSTVLHNVWLPNLNSKSNKKRQCDVVITSGKKPRQTITIVEVQKRSRKFDITFFDGIIQKMRDVGAQHLICVSMVGFTAAIKEKAMGLGGTVRLVKLAKDSTSIPLFLNLKFSESRPIYSYHTKPKIKFDITQKNKNGFQVKLNDKSLSFEPYSINLFSINDLIAFYFNLSMPKVGGIYPVKFPGGGINLFVKHKNNFLRISKFECEVKVEARDYEIPSKNIYSYEQEDSGPIAWLVEAKSVVDENLIRLTLNPGPDGTYILNGIQYVQYKKAQIS